VIGRGLGLVHGLDVLHRSTVGFLSSVFISISGQLDTDTVTLQH